MSRRHRPRATPSGAPMASGGGTGVVIAGALAAALLCTPSIAVAADDPGDPTREHASPTLPPEEVAACVGATLQRTDLEGCAEDTCATRPALLALLAAIPRGRPLDLTDLARFHAGLDGSRLVRDATVTCRSDPAGDVLVATVVPASFVRKVSIRGNDHFREHDLMKRVFLRPGTAIAVDPARPLDNEGIARQIESLLRLYRSAGLDLAKVTAIVTQHSPIHVDLAFVIDEGPRLRVDSVDAKHLHLGQPDPGGLACPTIETRRLERLLGVGAGDIFTRTTKRQLHDKLRSAFQAAGYERPSVSVEFGDDQRLVVRVETTHCWLVRVWQRNDDDPRAAEALSFRWRDPVHATTQPDQGTPFTRSELADWNAVLPFGESGSFDKTEATRGLDAIARTVRAQGYAFAEVALEHRELALRPERRGLDSEVTGIIDYIVTLNLGRRLRAIRFEGIRAFEEAELRATMQTQPNGFFSGGGAFDELRVMADLDALRRFYRERGYLAMTFRDGSAVTDPDTPPTLIRSVLSEEDERVTWRYTLGARGFRLVKHVGDPDIELVIRIDEGRPTTLTAIHAEGATLVDTAKLATIAGLAPGRPFGERALADALERLHRHYARIGHYRMKATTACQLGDAAELVACTPDNLAQHPSITLEIAIDEGPEIKVGAVVWRGTYETDPHILVRDLPKRGERLDLDRVDDAVRKLRTLSIFNSVRVDVLGLDGDAPSDEVTLVVAVEETRYRFLDFAFGLRSIQRENIGHLPAWFATLAGLFVGETDRTHSGFGRSFPLDIPDLLFTFDFEYLDLNEAGRGNQLRLPFSAGFSLSQFLRVATFDPSYAFPRLLDSPVTLTIRGIAELDRVTDPLDRLEVGAEAALSFPIMKQMLAGFTLRQGWIQLEPPDATCVFCLSSPAFTFGSGLTQDAAEHAADALACDGDSDSDACADKAFRPQLTFSFHWRWDTQDTPLHPRRGVVLAASTSFIIDRDRESSSEVFNQFVKWELSARGVISLGDLIFAAFVRYGGAVTIGDRDAFLPANDRFTLGQNNGLRGFTDNGLCRYDKQGKLDPTCPDTFGGNVLLNGSLELRVPLFKLGPVGIWAGAFFDVGALAEDHAKLYPSSFRFAAGLGLRILAGDLVPIRLDFGFPVFERRCIAYSTEGACVREKPSQFNFGFLYTF